MDTKVHIFSFAGSLRQGSYNRALLRNAVELVPPDATIEVFDLEGIPPFNQDLESAMPERVKEFKSKIKAADAPVIRGLRKADEAIQIHCYRHLPGG